MSYYAEKKLQEQLLAFQDQLSQETPPFTDNSTDAIRARYHQTGNDTDAFAKLYLPHYVDAEPAAFHYDLDAVAESAKGVYPIHGPREHAKSTRHRIKLLQMICTGRIKYWLIGSEYLSLAWNHLEFIRWEFRNNPRLRSDFDYRELKKDEQKGELRIEVTPKATSEKHRMKLEAIAYGTSAKGRLYLNTRPQGATLDDFENTRTAKNSTIGAAKVDWVLQELYPAVTGPVVWLGNISYDTSALYQILSQLFGTNEAYISWLKKGSDPGMYARHRECARAKVEADEAAPEIYGFVFKATRKVDSEFMLETLWPERFDISFYKEKQATMGYRFEGEENGNPIKPGKIFKQENFERYASLPDNLPWWYTWFDPAWGKSGHSAYKCWIILAADERHYYLVDAYCRQANPIQEALDAWHAAFLKWEGYGLRYGNYEGTFGQADRLDEDIEAAADRHGWRLNVYPKANPGDKDARIQSLEGPINQRLIKFPAEASKDIQAVIDQLLEYPDAEYVDGPDALEGAWRGIRRQARSGKMVAESAGKRRFSFRRHR